MFHSLSIFSNLFIDQFMQTLEKESPYAVVINVLRAKILLHFAYIFDDGIVEMALNGQPYPAGTLLDLINILSSETNL